MAGETLSTLKNVEFTFIPLKILTERQELVPDG